MFLMDEVMLAWLVSHLLPWREPKRIEGAGSLLKLPRVMRNEGIESVLIVTDAGLASLGLMQPLLDGLKLQGVRCCVYDKTVANPTVDNVEAAFAMYKEESCAGIVAFGGGSPMDCAKAVAMRAARPNKTLRKLRGTLKVRRRLPEVFAVPTTAGTGSEATLAAVITDEATREKYIIMDTALIPRYAVLDPTLTAGLPPHITAATGMDTLSHAVEAYIGRSNTKQTKAAAIEAAALVFDNLYTAYKDGGNMHARENMQKAAYLGGCAFTRAYVGYVHAVGHQLSAFYGKPHGLVNAAILPVVLEKYGAAVYQPLAELADAVQIGDHNWGTDRKAKRFIDAIREMNTAMALPEKIEGIRKTDIPKMVCHALREANPLYPVPVIWGATELTEVYHAIVE